MLSMLAAARGAGDTTLYEVAAPLLLGILLTGVLGETRLRHERNAAAGEREQWARRLVYAEAVVVVLVLVGIVASISALAQPPADDWEAVTVIVCVTAGVVTVSVVGFGPTLIDFMTDRARRWVARVAVSVLWALAGAGGVYVASATLDDDPKRHVFHVYGTCAAGKCGLNVRTHPTSTADRIRQLRDGNEVEIVCQTIGERMHTPNRVYSRIWDELRSGGYVTDLYVDTARSGRFSPDLPGCEAGDTRNARAG